MRAERLGVPSVRRHNGPAATEASVRRHNGRAEDLMLLAETDCEAIIATAEKMRPAALAVDSIQTLYLPELPSAPGSVSQVRECAARIAAFAKRTETPTWLVGHVTKDGSIAGPRVLEHMVDTVLYFEGDRGGPYRVLRAHKNRFGSTNEIGVFEMRETGLVEVPDPSSVLLAERPRGSSGSVVTAGMSGTRPVLCEVQALVAPASYGTARRTALGVDSGRVALLAAVLEKKQGVDLAGFDIFVNAAGGMEISEPAVDLAVVAAVVSSHRNEAVEPGTLVFGEVGLTGEVRGVHQIEQRLAEAAKLGFTRAIAPMQNARRARAPEGLEIAGVASVGEALEVLFTGSSAPKTH